MNRLTRWCAWLGCCLSCTAVQCQERPEFESSYNQRFLQRKSMLGQTAPDVRLFQADGQPWKLSVTRGKPTVLVFGCLT